jgi:uncharacterized membrane protein/protein-disulfide isomerase
MSTTTARLALIFACVGLGASATAAYTHYQLLANPQYLSFCDVSATISCTQVYASRFGSVAGVPVAIFGGIFFAFAALLAVAGLTASAEVKDSVAGYLFAASTLALSVVIYLGYASFAILNQVCLVCLTTYAAVIGLFVVAGAATSIPMLSLPRRLTSDLKALAASPLALALAALLVGGAATTLAFFPREGGSLLAGNGDAALATLATSSPAEADAQQAAQFEQWYNAQLRIPLVVPTEGAKVLVVKFNDYQCPACGQSHKDYKSVFAKYEATQPGAVRLVLKDFPLESECNSNVATTLHAASCEAAVAVRLAREKNLAAPVEEWLFSNQPAMTPQAVRQQVRQLAQVVNFDERYPITLEQVKADIAYGRQLGVRSTPTFFINGVKIEGALPAPLFDQAIAYELKRVPAP